MTTDAAPMLPPPPAPYRLRQALAADFPFYRLLHRTTMRGYVEAIWSWDDQVQEPLVAASFQLERTRIIEVDAQAAGSLTLSVLPGAVVIDNLMLMPTFQGRGIGSAIVSELIAQSVAQRTALRLTVLRPNPAKALYERLGFVTVRSDEIRSYMEHVPH